MAKAGWSDQPFNERQPFGKEATVVGGDNIQYSRQRYDAIKAVKNGTATPEQAALVHETDEIYREAMSQRS